MPNEPITPEAIDRCIELLTSLAHDPAKSAAMDPQKFIALTQAAGRFSRPNKDDIRLKHKAFYDARRKRLQLEDRQARATTGIRTARTTAVFQAPAQVTSGSAYEPAAATEQILKSARNCYVCKAEFTRLHFFYDLMCPPCAEFNYQKRFQTAPLHGRVVVITGARLKIGYQATLMLLRSGAKVIATTRFPIDAATRFAAEADFAQWGSRLEIYGLDLRHIPSVEIFCRYLSNTSDRLDILINNAAQTVRRPPGFYAHLMDKEATPFTSLPVEAQRLLQSAESCKAQLASLCLASPESSDSASLVAFHSAGPGIGLRASARLSQIPYAYDNSVRAEEIFPSGALDQDLQQVDLRQTNSWRLKLAEVAAPEMLEVQLVNAVAPFVLCSKLEPLMTRDFTGQKHIVNVSAMEGKFYRFTKASRHPHTNMAKAALNMLTHTSASDLEKKGIYMNAVDTGWVTDEDPAALSALKQERHDFQPPLDIVDGAARVCDPFFDGILTGKHQWGKFLKDYMPIDW